MSGTLIFQLGIYKLNKTCFLKGLDPEKHIHNPNLYAVWNLKAYMAYKVSNVRNTFKSSFFIYVDAGSFRTMSFAEWPDLPFVKQLGSKIEDKMLMGQINPSLNESINNPERDLIEGTFFAGSIKAIEHFATQFYFIHDTRFDKGLFIGKDQILYNIFVSNKATVRLNAFKNDCVFDKWFFFQIWLAKDSQYKCKTLKMNLLNFVN